MPLEILFQHAVDNRSLSFIDRVLVDLVPKLRFEEDVAKCLFGPLYRATKAIQKPCKPVSNVRCAALLSFQLVVILFPFSFNLA